MEQHRGSVLVIDDSDFVLEATALLLRGNGFDVEACKESVEAISKFKAGRYNTVLTDITMPHVSGIEVLEKIHDSDPDVPVILMTGYADTATTVSAIKKGAFDFIVKPYQSAYVIHSVEKAVKHYKLLQFEKGYKKKLENDIEKSNKDLAEALKMVKDMSSELVQRLTAVSEFRDTDTGAHIKRIGLYAGTISEELKMPADFTEALIFASTMHDIGKIGIPDSVLLKNGPLTSEEFDVMKTHTVIGEKMLADSPHRNIQKAAIIAMTHHERWDGSGYPKGLKGSEIPLDGRIVMLVDQYDALRSKRPYKEPISHKEVCKIITEGTDRTKPGHFDPEVLRAFVKTASFFDEIFESFKD